MPEAQWTELEHHGFAHVLRPIRTALVHEGRPKANHTSLRQRHEDPLVGVVKGVAGEAEGALPVLDQPLPMASRQDRNAAVLLGSVGDRYPNGQIR